MPETGTKRKEAARRGGAPRPLAAMIGGLTRQALGKRGFAEAGLITDWEAIVGQALAATSQPDRLSFPPGRRDGGTLRIRVAGGVATEIQHLEPMILERINGHFGYRAVERLVLVQAPLGKTGAAKSSRKKAGPLSHPPDPARLAEMEAHLAGVEDPDVRTALARLGRAMLASRDSGEQG